MPPEFRARIDEDLDQGLQAYMDKEGVTNRADAGRKLMEIGLQSAGIQPGEQLSMEQTLGHLDHAMTVFTVPLIPGNPRYQSGSATTNIPAAGKDHDGEPRHITLVSGMPPISGFILLSMLYVPVNVTGKLTIRHMGENGGINLLPYEGEHELSGWENWTLPAVDLGMKAIGPNDMNSPRLRQLSIVRAGRQVTSELVHHGTDNISFRLYLLVAPLSAWRSYAWGLKHEANRIVEQERIIEERMQRYDKSRGVYAGSTPIGRP